VPSNEWKLLSWNIPIPSIHASGFLFLDHHHYNNNTDGSWNDGKNGRECERGATLVVIASVLAPWPVKCCGTWSYRFDSIDDLLSSSSVRSSLPLSTAHHQVNTDGWYQMDGEFIMQLASM
jgi:hypothetical protein